MVIHQSFTERYGEQFTFYSDAGLCVRREIQPAPGRKSGKRVDFAGIFIDTGKYLDSGLYKRMRMLVIALDITVNVADQVGDGRKRTTPDRLLGNEPEPAFHLIEPGCIGGGEVQMGMRMFGEPGPHLGMFMGRVIIDDEWTSSCAGTARST